MTVSNNFIVPSAFAEKVKGISVYDMHGRVLERYNGKKNVFDMEKDFGISRKVVLVKIHVDNK